MITTGGFRDNTGLLCALPDDQGGGAVSWPDDRYGEPGGTGVPRGHLQLGREAQLGNEGAVAGGPSEAASASLLAQVCGTTVRWPLAMDTT